MILREKNRTFIEISMSGSSPTSSAALMNESSAIATQSLKGKELRARCRSAFSPRLGPTIFKGHEESEVNILNLRALRTTMSKSFLRLRKFCSRP